MANPTILQSGDFATTGNDPPKVRLPDRQLFSRRARRLRQLATGHSMADYLRFAAALAEAQQQQLKQLPVPPLPDQNVLEQCRQHHMPLLAPAGWPRDPIWRTVAQRLTEALDAVAPAPAHAAFARLRAAETDWLEAQAESLLSEGRSNLDLACAPVIGAALQVSGSDWPPRSIPPGSRRRPPRRFARFAALLRLRARWAARATPTAACGIYTAPYAARSGTRFAPNAASATTTKVSFISLWKMINSRSRPKPAPNAAVT